MGIIFVNMKLNLILTALMFLATISQACSCMRTSTEDLLKKSSAVFQGRVIKKTEIKPDRPEGPMVLDKNGKPMPVPTFEMMNNWVITFEVLKAWKGVTTSTVDLSVGSG